MGWNVSNIPKENCDPNPTNEIANGSGKNETNKKKKNSKKKNQEETFHNIAKSKGSPSVIICDRGGMDSAAYVSKEEWEHILEVNGWSVEEDLREGRYDQVSHLGKKIY